MAPGQSRRAPSLECLDFWLPQPGQPPTVTGFKFYVPCESLAFADMSRPGTLDNRCRIKPTTPVLYVATRDNVAFNRLPSAPNLEALVFVYQSGPEIHGSSNLCWASQPSLTSVTVLPQTSRFPPETFKRSCVWSRPVRFVCLMWKPSLTRICGSGLSGPKPCNCNTGICKTAKISIPYNSTECSLTPPTALLQLLRPQYSLL